MTGGYFTDDELRCKCGCRQLVLSPAFREHLNDLRESFGRPMIVNSCCRCFEHNQAIGGHPKSLHVCDKSFHKTKGTCAVDIDTSSMSKDDREKLIFLASAKGWSVGLGKTFLHLDLRTAYTAFPQACFNY